MKERITEGFWRYGIRAPEDGYPYSCCCAACKARAKCDGGYTTIDPRTKALFIGDIGDIQLLAHADPAEVAAAREWQAAREEEETDAHPGK